MPASFDAAFQAARYLVLEADLDAAASPAFQQYVLSKAQYPVGSYLKSRISTQLYSYIMGYAAQNGLASTAFDSYRPWFINNYISVDKFLDQGLSADLGVDKHYLTLAKQMQKPRKFLETLQQQIDFIANSSESEWVKGLSAHADLLPVGQWPIQTGAQLIAKWRGGKIEAFEEDITGVAREMPSVYDNLIRKRNQAWLPQIETQLKSGEVAMVLVGALHFAGPDGLLTQLRTKGYSITQLPFTELPPAITAQPQPVTVTVGQAVQFRVTATGTAPLNYQWQRNTQNILGATGAIYAIASAQLANAGDYRVVVSNGAGNAISQVAKLTVNAAAVVPAITAQPQPVTVTVGQAVQFSVIATGTAPLNYQWQRNTQNIPAATAATYFIASAQVANAGDYRVVVSNGAGNVTSQVAKLTVNAAVSELQIVQLRLLPTAEIEADLSFIATGDYVLEATSEVPRHFQWLDKVGILSLPATK